jgi:hypothetical protein
VVPGCGFLRQSHGNVVMMPAPASAMQVGRVGIDRFNGSANLSTWEERAKMRITAACNATHGVQWDMD